MPPSKKRKKGKPNRVTQPIRPGGSGSGPESRGTFRGAFRETYLQDWLDSGKALVTEDQYVRQVVEQRLGEPEYHAERLIRDLNRRMVKYANDWPSESRIYERNGLYKEVVDFIGPQDGLLVEIGAGTSNFIAAWGSDNVLGVDSNGYVLQRGEEFLTRAGKEVSRYSRTIIGFDQSRGFVLKPHPSQAEIDLEGITLMFDEVQSLDHTAEVLERNGTKADIVTFMLGGGVVCDDLNFLDPVKNKTELRHVPILVNNLYKISHPGTKVYFGLVTTVGSEAELRRATGTGVQQYWSENHGNVIEYNRNLFLPLPATPGRAYNSFVNLVETTFKGT